MTEVLKIPKAFNDWWDGEMDDSKNPFREDSAAYWAFAGWQAALASQAQAQNALQLCANINPFGDVRNANAREAARAAIAQQTL